MLSLKPTGHAMRLEALTTPGGFSWWYAELHDAAHDRALVVIWSFGLPFLPGLASSERRGRAVAARERPSVNLVCYEGGREVFYLLHEVAPETAREEGKRLVFGPSVVQIDVERGRLEATLDLPVPGSSTRVSGSLVVEGVPVTVAPALATPGDHGWTPLLLPATGRASLVVDDATFALSGAAYVDHNESARALHRLGIEHWIWGHARADDGTERVFYVLTPDDGGASEAHAFFVDAGGVLRRADDVVVDITARRGPRYGMSGIGRVSVRASGAPFLELTTTALVDDGPFYLRYLGAAGAHAASLEAIAPARIDTAITGRLAHMRVSSETRPASPFLPLFSGPATGRFRRFLRAR